MILMLVSACDKSTRGPDFCLVYEPQFYADTDSEFTKVIADKNNAVYECECAEDPVIDCP